MNPVEIITRKRDGKSLSREELADIVRGYVDGSVPDYQMAALAMAIYFQGMNAAETAALTDEMLNSGARLEWSAAGLPKVDKHSTGGIGDKVSLVLAPLLACCGLQVPMISGRGLGPTGGTLDKLESIPGFRTDLSLGEIRDITERVGCVITGATADLVPADRKLYALRDVTGTVPSIPLITASIMSKKLAESLDALVLDVKYGIGAFMKSLDDARRLAQSMVAVGRQMGVPTTALVTDMNQPLGRMVGNVVEVNEAVAALSGEGPPDLIDLTLALGAELLVSTGMDDSRDAAIDRQQAELASGRALEKFREMVAAQGGDPDACLRVAPATELTAHRSGSVAAIDAERFGFAVIELGGGRRKLGDELDHAVGLEMLVRIGDDVERGQPLVRIFADRDAAAKVMPAIEAAIEIADAAVEPRRLIEPRLEIA